ncbi:MAG: HTH domain-containing protein [Clostridia bacterium]|nr:HTH domain-containing protein [Clostridia bacterium]
MKKYDVAASILEILEDNEIHSMNEIAEKLELSRLTVFRHIQTLSLHYDIETFKGGQIRGGVRLKTITKLDVSYLSSNDLQSVMSAIGSLQDPEGNIQRLVKDLANRIRKEQENDRFRKENCSREVG